jgi:hypothetical protein
VCQIGQTFSPLDCTIQGITSIAQYCAFGGRYSLFTSNKLSKYHVLSGLSSQNCWKGNKVFHSKGNLVFGSINSVVSLVNLSKCFNALLVSFAQSTFPQTLSCLKGEQVPLVSLWKPTLHFF